MKEKTERLTKEKKEEKSYTINKKEIGLPISFYLPKIAHFQLDKPL